MEPYVVYVGQSQYDEYYEMPDFPRKGAKTFCKEIPTILGGMIANAACVSAHYGLKTYLLDTLNYSPMSARMISEMTSLYGLDMTQIYRDDNCSDSKCVILLHGNDRTILVVENDRPPMVVDEEKLEFLSNAAYIYSGGDAIELLEPLEEVIDAVIARGTKIFLDLDSFNVTSNMSYVMDHASIISLNEHGFEDVRGERTKEQTIKDLLSKGLEVLVITKGADGCEAHTKDGSVYIPGISVDVVDTTGAGDTFNSSFLFAIIKGYELEEALKFASCAASNACLKVGARAGATTEEEVRELMKKWF